MTFVLIGKNIHVTYWRIRDGESEREKKNTKLPSLVGQEEEEEGVEEGKEEEEGGKSTSLVPS